MSCLAGGGAARAVLALAALLAALLLATPARASPAPVSCVTEGSACDATSECCTASTVPAETCVPPGSQTGEPTGRPACSANACACECVAEGATCGATSECCTATTVPSEVCKPPDAKQSTGKPACGDDNTCACQCVSDGGTCDNVQQCCLAPSPSAKCGAESILCDAQSLGAAPTCHCAPPG